MTRERERERELGPGELDTDAVLVRDLREDDFETIVRIDASAMGRERPSFYRKRLRSALHDSGMHVSLVAELDRLLVGFLLAQVHYGEFGRVEPAAVIDAIGVHKDFRGKKVGKALMRQLLLNLRALRVEHVRTEVEWNDLDLIRFLDSYGFAPSRRVVLELSLEE